MKRKSNVSKKKKIDEIVVPVTKDEEEVPIVGDKIIAEEDDELPEAVPPIVLDEDGEVDLDADDDEEENYNPLDDYEEVERAF